MPKKPKPDDVPRHEETDSPTYADDHNFYKVEKWTRDGTKVDSLLYAGNSLGRARAVFERSINASEPANTALASAFTRFKS
jgi:thiamine monophosphate kinase